jgi:hypothetical protein
MPGKLIMKLILEMSFINTGGKKLRKLKHR